MTQTTRIGSQNNPALLRQTDLPGTHTTSGYRDLLDGARDIIKVRGWDALDTILAAIRTRYTALALAPARLGAGIANAPTINNVINAKVGKKLALSLPKVDGLPLPVATFQWVRGASTNISGATAATYTPQVADVGSTLKCTVTWTNGVGSPLVETTAPTNAVLA